MYAAKAFTYFGFGLNFVLRRRSRNIVMLFCYLWRLHWKCLGSRFLAKKMFSVRSLWLVCRWFFRLFVANLCSREMFGVRLLVNLGRMERANVPEPRLHGDRVQRNMQMNKIKISWFACFQKPHTHITCNLVPLVHYTYSDRLEWFAVHAKRFGSLNFLFVIATSTCSTISLSIPCTSVRLCVHWHFIIRQNGCLLCTNVRNWSFFVS